ncbi:4'-phosphopantetheinyl transferase superfamily protein [Streptomyces sclerotialus]|uniref:4'-phosphopantetheinyl transferase superfamily protein n=1 Tax=Streptomyces sclerotialus TaxID=1957 RepID=UPI000AD4C8E5
MRPVVPLRYGTTPLPDRWNGGPPRLWLARHRPGEAVAGADEALLDAEERERAAAFAHAADRAAYLAAHAMLRRLLGAYLGIAADRVRYARERCPCCGEGHGRPSVVGAPLHFSLSRSGEFTLVAVAATAVGVDIEEIPRPDTARAVTSALHTEERQELACLPSADRLEAFTRCWARKEAYLKATGHGLAEGVSHVHVGAGPRPAELDDWSLTDVTVPRRYRAACATQGRQYP